jgi:DNA helicase-2/ATP-dependent DNA helicase PcrA
VKDTLALLSFLVNPRDEIAFRRMVNKPSRGVGPATAGRIVEEAMRQSEETRGNLALAARNLAPDLPPKARSGVTAFLKAIEAGRAALTPDSSPKPARSGDGLKYAEGLSTCVVRLAEESGIAQYHLTNDEISGNQRLGNLQELANAASIYPASDAGLLEFLEHIELDRSMEDNSNAGGEAVTLITLHNTKGLEFRRVIMTGIEQGIFPRDDKKGDDLEEERRLFYVGATRAMDELYLTSCEYRRMYGRTEKMHPSIFLGEIDRKALKIIGSLPPGFSSPSAGFSPGKSGGFLKTSSDGRWTLGDRVYHDDHGYGSITEIRESGDGPAVKVIFETGHETRFLSIHQSSRYTRIRDD